MPVNLTSIFLSAHASQQSVCGVYPFPGTTSGDKSSSESTVEGPTVIKPPSSKIKVSCKETWKFAQLCDSMPAYRFSETVLSNPKLASKRQCMWVP